MRLLMCGIAACIALSSPSSCDMAVSIYNHGFEEGTTGWGWQSYNGCRALYRPETRAPKSGSRCLAVSSKSGAAPHVYGRLSQQVSVLPNTVYEMSVWARGDEVEGEGGVPHFTDWSNYTLNLPTGTFDWQRVAVRFRTKPNQFVLNIGLNIVNKCKELAIDDIAMTAVGVPLTGAGVTGSFLAPTRLIGNNAPSYLDVALECGPDAARVEAAVTSAGKTVFGRKAALKRGSNSLKWEWTSGSVPAGDLECTVRVLDKRGGVLASASQAIAKEIPAISAAIDKVEQRFAAFDKLYKQCRAKRIPLDYPTATRTLLAQFIPFAREDVQKGHDWRAEFAVKDLNRALDEGIAELKAYLNEPGLAPNVPRYKTGKVTIDGQSFIGNRVDSRGARSRGPLFFCGHGHFYAARRDIPLWPGYGVNMIQSAEFGPSAVLLDENTVSLEYPKQILKAFDDAAKHNVKVDLLLSPHYFPQWAMDKYESLGKGGGGFLGYCVDEAEAKQVVEKFLRAVVPLFKDHPALHSFCLSNEPIFSNTAGCENTTGLWSSYLARVHGDLKTMNERFGTNYAAFADVPIPGNESYTDPQFYDFCVFNQERFAGWHQWMADICRELAPNVPVHAKMMSMALPHRFTVSWGCDPELFGELSDINGNDCLIRGSGGPNWSIPWHTQNMSYDLQRSLADKPVFNSENHPTDDRSTSYLPPEHFKTAYWQGAIHGQGATTTWVWERSFDPGSDLYGNVMDRPGCALALGTTCLDLNRFAEEVTALQNARSPVAILFSIASITRSERYLNSVLRAYTALNLTGARISFISEKQLLQGVGSRFGLVVLPADARVLPATFDRLQELAKITRLVFLGDTVAADPYGKAYPADSLKAIRELSLCVEDGNEQTVLWPVFLGEMASRGLHPEVSVVNAKTGEPVWGVEWLPAVVGGRTVVNMVNLTNATVEVSILRGGSIVPARNLLSLGGREPVKLLKPITPVLAEVGSTPAGAGRGPAEVTINFTDAGGAPIPKAAIKELICRDLADEPVVTTISIADGAAKVTLPKGKPVQFSALLPVPGFGEVAIYADHGGNGYSRAATIDFVKEAAATRRVRVKAAITQAQKEGVPGMDAQLANVVDAAKMAPHKSLALTLAVGEEVTLARARHRIDQLKGPREGFLFGCNAFGYPKRGPLYPPRFRGIFNYGTTNLYLTGYAPSETERNYSRCDAETEWLLSMGMTTKPCPPFYLAGGVTPQWLRDKSWPEVRHVCGELVRGVCQRYAGKTPFCEITNEATMSNGLKLTAEQIIEYTRVASQAAREGDPKVRRIINSAHLWGDYAAKPDREGKPRLSPFAYVRRCIEEGIEFEITGLQMYYPEYDLLEIDRMLDRYAALGKPIHITEMGCASADGIDPNAQRKKAAAGWHGPWTESMQADWVEAVYTLFYSKPYIEAVSWWDLADAVSFWPYGGLCRGDLSPKPAYDRLKALQKKWGFRFGD